MRTLLPVLILSAGLPLGCSDEPDVAVGEPSKPIGPSDPTPAPASSWRDAPSYESNAGSYIVHVLPTPDPIPDNHSFTLDVWVRDIREGSEPRDDVAIEVDAAMPEHGHGMNRLPRVAVEEDGRFRVSGMLFHMTGNWELYVDVTRGAVTERAQFRVFLE